MEGLQKLVLPWCVVGILCAHFGHMRSVQARDQSHFIATAAGDSPAVYRYE
jgi:hypothetical protein